MRRGERGITLVEIAAIVTVVIILVTILIPPLLRGRRQERLDACQANFRTLSQAQTSAGGQALPFEPGRAFWLRFLKTSPPLVAPSTLRCPLSTMPDPLGCDYFGPSGDIGGLPPGEPIGCDRDINHSLNGSEGGCVLLRDGRVLVDRKGLWSAAFQLGRCRP